MVSLSTILGLFTGSGLFKAAKDNLLTIGMVGAVVVIALMWRSDLIEKGVQKQQSKTRKATNATIAVGKAGANRSGQPGVRRVRAPGYRD